MRTGTYVVVAHTAIATAHPPSFRPGFLHLVTSHEMRELEENLMNGAVPADFERKLSLLEQGGVMHQFIAQNCRLFILALRAVYAGLFKEISQHDRDQVLRVLAYVRKDDDAIPDYASGGFGDDLQEVRAVILHLQGLLHRFKAWRLCHQVPAMWRN